MVLFVIDPWSVCLTEFNSSVRKNIIDIEVCILETYFPVPGVTTLDNIPIVDISTIPNLMGIKRHSHVTLGIIK